MKVFYSPAEKKSTQKSYKKRVSNKGYRRKYNKKRGTTRKLIEFPSEMATALDHLSELLGEDYSFRRLVIESVEKVYGNNLDDPILIRKLAEKMKSI